MKVPPLFAFFACSFIWGTTWLAIKIGYEGLDPLWGASLRFFLAGLLMIPLIIGNGLGPPRGVRQLGVVAVVGLVLFGADYGLIYWGEQFLTSGLTAILFATLPLFMALFSAVLIPAERLTPRHVAGAVVGFGGLCLIFWDELRLGSGALGPQLAIVLSAACAALSSVVVRRWGRDLSPIVLNGTAMFIGAVALWAASLAMGETAALPLTGRAWASLLFLVLFGSIVSFLLFWGLLKVWTANRAGLIPLVTPVVAVTTGFFVGERLAALQWLGSAIVLAGVALALAPRPGRSTVLAAPSAPAK